MKWYNFSNIYMKEFFKIVDQIYHSHDLDFYLSLFGPLLMGTIHLASVIMHFDWITLNYCVFAYMIVLFKTWQWAIVKFNMKINPYISALILLGHRMGILGCSTAEMKMSLGC